MHLKREKIFKNKIASQIKLDLYAISHIMHEFNLRINKKCEHKSNLNFSGKMVISKHMQTQGFRSSGFSLKKSEQFMYHDN